MGRTTKQLSGGGKDKFLRALIASEPEIAAATAERLGETMSAAIADIRVRREAWEPTALPGAKVAHAPPPAAPKAKTLAKAPTPPAAPAAPTFDPFQFSALAVLTKNGATELKTRLGTIANVADLRALAQAQHLTIDATLKDPDALRTAIVSATEKRLAERRAAAS